MRTWLQGPNLGYLVLATSLWGAVNLLGVCLYVLPQVMPKILFLMMMVILVMVWPKTHVSLVEEAGLLGRVVSGLESDERDPEVCTGHQQVHVALPR